MNGDRILWVLRQRAPHWLPRLLALLAATLAVVWLAVLLPLQQEVTDAEREQLVKRDGMLRSVDINRAGDPQERLTRFYEFFGADDGLPGRLSRLYAVSRANGLEMRRAEYRMAAPADQKLARYQIILPVEGSYLAIRRFTAQALDEIPTLALSQVKFQRRRIGEGRAEAQIIFTLYLKP